MAEWDAELRRDQRRGHGRVDVTGDQDQVRPDLVEHRLEALDDPRRLLGVGARAHAEHVLWGADAQFLEKDARHDVVVVLARMHEHVIEPIGTSRQLRDDRRGLHEVRSRAYDERDGALCSHGGRGS